MPKSRRVIPLPAAYFGAAAIVAIGADTVSYGTDIGNGPLYTMIGVIAAALIAGLVQIVVNRRRTVPQTPDVADAILGLTAAVAALKAQVSPLAELPEQVGALAATMVAQRHQQKGTNTELFIRLGLIEEHVRPWPQPPEGPQ